MSFFVTEEEKVILEAEAHDHEIELERKRLILEQWFDYSYPRSMHIMAALMDINVLTRVTVRYALKCGDLTVDGKYLGKNLSGCGKKTMLCLMEMVGCEPPTTESGFVKKAISYLERNGYTVTKKENVI